MSAVVDEIYAKIIRPLPDSEKLEIASIILDEVTKKSRAVQPVERKGDISKFVGMFGSGDPNSANNERIDVDLARAYAETHESED